MTTTKLAQNDVGAHEKKLAASVIDVVEFERNLAAVEVANIDGAGAIYFTVDGTDPTVGGAHCHLLPPFGCSRTISAPLDRPTVVKLISSATPIYDVSKADY